MFSSSNELQLYPTKR